MLYSQVRYEGHARAATIYVAGMLETLAAARAVSAIAAIHEDVRTIRVDLRGVSYIDPDSFVRLARALSTWHHRTRGLITIAFPSQSEISVERRAERRADVLWGAAPALEETERSSEAIARVPQAVQ